MVEAVRSGVNRIGFWIAATVLVATLVGKSHAQAPTTFIGPVDIQRAPTYQAGLVVSRSGIESSAVDSYSNGGGHHMRFFSPDPYKGDVLRTYINEGGAFYTNAWMVISGALTDYTSAVPNILHPTNDSFMLGIWSDVTGPALVVRPTMTSHPDPTLATMDGAGNYRLGVLADGSLVFADSTSNSFADTSWDTILHRVGRGRLRTEGRFSAAGLSDTPTLVSLLNNSASTVQPGTVLVIDTTADKAFVPSRSIDDPLVMGIANETIAPGAVGAVLTRGVTKVNVLGPLARGDLIITSNATGYAQRLPPSQVPRPASIIGKALSATANSTGHIDVLVSM